MVEKLQGADHLQPGRVGEGAATRDTRDLRAAPVPARTLFPLAEVAAAHSELEQHRVQGRLLLVW
jgi:hypothetical protein